MFYSNHCQYLPPMIGWFIFSSILSSYNKYVFGKTYMAFPCPLLLTSMHFLWQYLLSVLFTSKLLLYCDDSASLRILEARSQLSSLSWRAYLTISLPCGLVTSADIGFSNLALVRITMTFYTMIKSSSPIFVVISAYLFKIEQITTMILFVVCIISIGELMTVLGEVEFDFLGFLFCLSASICSGIRWTIIQYKLQNLNPPIKSIFLTIRVLAPTMFVSMLAISFLVERPWEQLLMGKESYIKTWRDGIWVLLVGVIGAKLAVLMVLCEFYLMIKTSAIILMIAGVVKELCTITIGVLAFHDDVNTVNFIGCIILFLGVAFYKVHHHQIKLKETTSQNYKTVDTFLELEPNSVNESYLPSDGEKLDNIE